MSKILTVCQVGLSRSVGMTDVLKFHFEPTDVIPVGYAVNSKETFEMLIDWADHIILMETHYRERLQKKLGLTSLDTYCSEHNCTVHICDVGPDIYGYSSGGQGRAILIDKAWRWARANQDKLGITEHPKSV